MSDRFLAGLVAIVLVALALRLSPVLPLKRATKLDPVDWALLFISVVALVFHCGAMFFPHQTGWLHLEFLADKVRAFRTPSKLLYAVPALVVVLALRKVPVAVLLVLTATLLAVGITMYDGARLNVHLTTIALATAAISFTTASFARR